jgi:hypothetical protein
MSSNAEFDRIHSISSPIQQAEPSAPLGADKPSTSTNIGELYPRLTFEHSHIDVHSSTTHLRQHTLQLDVEQTDRPYQSTVSQHSPAYTFMARPTEQIIAEVPLISRAQTTSILPVQPTISGPVEQIITYRYTKSGAANGGNSPKTRSEIPTSQSNFSRSHKGMEQNTHWSDQLLAPIPFANDGK